jgi:NAD(P)-dependent dehydrogenase (short-subunit alcohol dehydrogenase family)
VTLITGTGTGSGQGRAAALLFAREGAKIAGCDVHADNQDETVRLVREAGGEMYSVAICSRGKHRQAIGILDLPLPAPSPVGAEWISAYRRWASDRERKKI